METLARRSEVFWPTWKPKEEDHDLPLGADRAIRMACGLTIGDIWVHIVEVALEKNCYPTQAAKEVARRELIAFREAQKQRRTEERSLADVCAWLMRELTALGER